MPKLCFAKLRNAGTSTDERHPCRWEPAMLNRIQRHKVDTTTLVSWQYRQLASEALSSGFVGSIAVKTARMANAKNQKSATGHAKCGRQPRAHPITPCLSRTPPRPALLRGEV